MPSVDVSPHSHALSRGCRSLSMLHTGACMTARSGYPASRKLVHLECRTPQKEISMHWLCSCRTSGCIDALNAAFKRPPPGIEKVPVSGQGIASAVYRQRAKFFECTGHPPPLDGGASAQSIMLQTVVLAGMRPQPHHLQCLQCNLLWGGASRWEQLYQAAEDDTCQGAPEDTAEGRLQGLA